MGLGGCQIQIERITNQVNAGIGSFAFFLMNNRKERELFVGKINRLYDKKKLLPLVH